VGRNRRREDDWAEARRRCRLSADDVRRARELGLNPRKLIENIPSPSQRWKAPVAEWVRGLYRKRHGHSSAGPPRPLPSGRPPSLPAPLGEPEGPDQLEDVVFGDDEPWGEPERTWREEIEEQDRLLLRRQEELRTAADFVAAAFARLPFVERVVLFGSVARPLQKEVPRFREFRRAGVALWHECKDVDLAVRLSDLSGLETLQKARGNALNDVFALAEVGVAHHQVDVFLFEPGSDRYLGRLCRFGTCPKGKPECRAPGCGAALFLQQHEGFVFDPRSLAPERSRVLFDRGSSLGPPSLGRWLDRIPF
jgi:hypothetical protein